MIEFQEGVRVATRVASDHWIESLVNLKPETFVFQEMAQVFLIAARCAAALRNGGNHRNRCRAFVAVNPANRVSFGPESLVTSGHLGL
jgi:hypothetical protein